MDLPFEQVTALLRRAPVLRHAPAVPSRAGVLRWGIATALATALVAGGWMWLRDSSLVAVQRVRIAGVRGPQSVQIDAALRAAARRMTTLHFDARALRSAVAAFPAVQAVRVSTGFPHEVSITVSERPAVAVLVANGQRTALAADGTVLGAALLSASLPVVHGTVVPPVGRIVTDEQALMAVRLLGSAPASLRRTIERAYRGPEGLTVAMRDGLVVYFGDATRPHAKWLSLASVLADPASAGATYVDVRVPQRPSAGHTAVGASAFAAGPSASGEAAAVPSTSAAAVLAERLAGTTGASSTAPAAQEGESASSETAGSSEGPTAGAAPVEAQSPPSVGGAVSAEGTSGASGAAGTSGTSAGYAGAQAAQPSSGARAGGQASAAGAAEAPSGA